MNQQPPKARRMSLEEIELHARQSMERTKLMGQQNNERVDMDERHARELAELLAPRPPANGVSE